jgi:hypothetical protein
MHEISTEPRLFNAEFAEIAKVTQRDRCCSSGTFETNVLKTKAKPSTQN